MARLELLFDGNGGREEMRKELDSGTDDPAFGNECSLTNKLDGDADRGNGDPSVPRKGDWIKLLVGEVDLIFGLNLTAEVEMNFFG